MTHIRVRFSLLCIFNLFDPCPHSSDFVIILDEPAPLVVADNLAGLL